MFSEFRRRFWLPPRAHGEIIEDRAVSYLELFYDLVYVVVIGRAAHTLAESITWRTVGEFVVVFGVIWLAWMNGTMYYDLHGREEGRTRFFVFVQMVLLAILAVFASDAMGETGAQFAVVYTLYLIVVSWLWYTVRRRDSAEYMAVTAIYLTAMLVSVVVMGLSAFLPAVARSVTWAGLLVLWFATMMLVARSETMVRGARITDSMVERHGLFVIIVLGEVIVGAVDGLSEVELTPRAVLTAMVGLGIGFAYWWTYFDYVGRRLPIDLLRFHTRWLLSHFPVVLSIAASGAAMVSLVGHAEDSATPPATAWALTGAVAVGMLSLVVQMRTLGDYERLPSLYQPVKKALLVSIVPVLLVGWWAPVPWLLALILVLILGVVWIFAVSRWLGLEDPDAIAPNRA
jgi:low temperature requirement protein LtrA